MPNRKKTKKDNAALLFRRYLWLLETIYRKGNVTFEEINDEWLRNSSLNPERDDIPLRTFHSHRSAVQEMFDINITCDRKNGYVYHIEDELTDKGNKMRNWMLNSLSVNSLIRESKDMKKHILLEEIPSGQDYLIPLIEAIRSGNKVEFTYKSYWEPNSKDVLAEPYCLKLFRQRWYLLAIKTDKQELRTYPLDRMSNLKTTEQKFRIPDDFDPDAYFADFLGVLTDFEEDVQTVKIRVFDEQLNYLKSLPLHHSQELINETESYADFSFFITPTFDFIQALLMYGSKLEVLEPEWLRNDILETADEIIKIYRKQ